MRKRIWNYIKFKFSFFENILLGFLDYFSLKIKRNVVIFYFPSDHEQISGGALSILYLFQKSKTILNDSNVFCAFFNKYPRVEKYTWLENDVVFLNLYYRKFIIKKAIRVLIHVPEVWISKFRLEWDQLDIAKENPKVEINILNQNQNYLPSPLEINNSLGVFNNFTMTLAFIRNLKECTLSYPNIDIFNLSAWFYKTQYEIMPFEMKKNIILISPDEHPLKNDIIRKLKSLFQFQIFEMTFLPYEEFKILQKDVKYTISFGEGYDNYFQGAYFTGGIGLSVYNEVFFHDEFKKDSLPKTIFPSYEVMLENIVNVINELNIKFNYESYNKMILSIVKKYNNPDLVNDNLQMFYKKTKFIS